MGSKAKWGSDISCENVFQQVTGGSNCVPPGQHPIGRARWLAAAPWSMTCAQMRISSLRNRWHNPSLIPDRPGSPTLQCRVDGEGYSAGANIWKKIGKVKRMPAEISTVVAIQMVLGFGSLVFHMA